jgi:hypothetical protein
MNRAIVAYMCDTGVDRRETGRQMDQDSPGQQPHGQRKVISVSCTAHGAARGFTNLTMRGLDGEIELTPHVPGSCVIELDESEACALRDTLTEWLG